MKSLDTRYETLALDEATPGVVVVTLNRPDRYNAMTNTMFEELEQVALALDHEHACRVVVLTGAGRAFCSGYDLAHAENVAVIRAWLRAHGIWNVGRFGEWQYFNMDHSMRSGRTAAQQILAARPARAGASAHP